MTSPSGRANERLRQERLLRGWSQKDVADRIGANYYYLSRWERGTTAPSPYYRQKLCALFGKNAVELGLLAEEDEEGDEPKPAATASSQVIDPGIPLPATGAFRLVGREVLLAQIKNLLCNTPLPLFTALYGLPGAGKTALAALLAHDPEIQAHFPDGLLWAGLGPQPETLSIFSHWGTLLGLDPPAPSSQESALAAWTLALRHAIGQRRMLLLIDDAWTMEDLLAFKVGGPFCAYVATTRFPQIAMQFANHEIFKIEELTGPESVTLLKQFVPQLVSEEPGQLSELIRAVGGLPLALILIGNHLRMQAHTLRPRRIRASIEALRDAERRLQLSLPLAPLERFPALNTASTISLQTVITTSYQQLEETLRGVLCALAVFPPKPGTFSEEAALAVAATDIDTLDRLADTGLLECRGPDRYTLHQTIADYARTQLTDTQPYQRLASYFTGYLEARQQDHEALAQEMVNILSALEAAFTCALSSELVRGVLAWYNFLETRGFYALAEQQLTRAEQACRSLHNRTSLIEILRMSGKVAEYRGNAARAEQCYREALQLAQEHGQEKTVSGLLTALAALLNSQGDYTRTQEVLQEALILARQIEDPEPLIPILNLMGSMANEHGDFLQGETYLLEALELLRRTGDKIFLFKVLNNLSSSTAEQGNYVDAEAYLLEASELARQQGHRSHLCASLCNIGAVFSMQQKYTQAEAVLRESLTIARQIEHLEWQAFALANLGELASKRDRPEEASAFLQEALALARQIGQRWTITTILMDLGEVYLKQQKIEAAQAAFVEARTWSNQEQSLALLADALYGLARLAQLREDFPEAKRLGQESLATYEACSHRRSAELRDWLSTLSAER